MKYVKLFEQFEENISEGKDTVKVVYRVLGNNYETIMHNTTEKEAVKRLGEVIVGGWQLVSTEIVNESAIMEGNISFKGRKVGDLLKKAGKKLGGESFLVQDIDGHEWAVFPDMDTKNTDKEIYAMDQYDNEKMLKIADISLIYEGRLLILDETSLNEAATKDYDPPKFLVLPALNPETQEPDDKIDAFMRAELEKRESYYKPGIRSANPPKNNNEVKVNIDEPVVENENLNENRFKNQTAMFGYKIDTKGRLKLPKKSIPVLAKVVKEYTDAYKSFDQRDRNIWDLTDALMNELNDMGLSHKLKRWDEEIIASYIIDAFRNGLNVKDTSIENIESMLSQLPLDNGWGI